MLYAKGVQIPRNVADQPEGSKFYCARCEKEHEFPENKEGFGAAGYAVDSKTDALYCYPCSGQITLEKMNETGKTCLYLSSEDTITDWPGTVQIKPLAKKKGKIKNTFSRTGYIDRTTVWFKIPTDAHVWVGINQGDNGILRCKRTQRYAL